MVFLYAAASLLIVRHCSGRGRRRSRASEGVYSSILARPDLGRGDPRVCGDAADGSARRLLRGDHLRPVGQGRVHAVERPAREPARAVRRRLVRRCRARRVHVGPHVPAPAQHRVLSRDADADAAPGGRRSGCTTARHRAIGSMLRALWAGVVISLAAFLWALHLRRPPGPRAHRGRARRQCRDAARRLSLCVVLQRAVHRVAVPARRRRRVLSLQAR